MKKLTSTIQLSTLIIHFNYPILQFILKLKLIKKKKKQTRISNTKIKIIDNIE
jgi:hypothetical protein